jgi:hypothetical protein
LRYDNRSAAVRKILRGHRREETARFVAFRSHWGFQAKFCTLCEGHEKGGVEGEAGFFRLNHLVPVPAARDLDELNATLLARCTEGLGLVIGGRQQTIGKALTIERQHLLPMPAEGFDLVEVSFGYLDDKRIRGAVAAGCNGPGEAGASQRRDLSTSGVASHAACARTTVIRRSSTWSTTWTCWSTNQVRAATAWKASSTTKPPGRVGVDS